MTKHSMIRVFLVFLVLMFTAFLAIAENFAEKATRACQKDFEGQEIRLAFDYPERLQKLSDLDEIIDYKNLSDGRVQFLVKGDSRPLTAKVDIMTTIPVFARPISPSSIIGEDDIAFVKVASSKIQGSAVLKKEELVGKKPRNKIIQAMVPIQGTDIETPIAVKRDSLVKLIYVMGNLQLTTQAKALKDGAVGQRAPFETTGKVKKQLDAVILDSSTVEVRART